MNILWMLPGSTLPKLEDPTGWWQGKCR